MINVPFTYIMTKIREPNITPPEIHWVFITEHLTFKKKTEKYNSVEIEAYLKPRGF